MSFNIITRMIIGKRYFGEDEFSVHKEAVEFRQIAKEIFEYMGLSNVGDFVPFMRLFDFQNIEKKLKVLQKKMNSFVQRLITQQRLEKHGDSMIDHLLSLQESQPQYYTDEIIKNIWEIFITGTQSSSITIEWAMAALLNHPEKLEKARIEIDSCVGPSRLVDETDIYKLPYLQAIISETLRLFPPAPLLVPHMSSDDCQVAGFDVPRGTMLIVNAWAIHRDPSIWDDPNAFKPERFMSGETKGEAYKMLPFGMGRRACPGSVLGQRVVGLTMASLIQSFEWKRVDGKEIDLMEGKGIAMPKAEPLEVMCKAHSILLNVLNEPINSEN
ncbi:cytochrome P450 81Q32-like [Impatiens glandulifera]|uniref:cytochrome P450 81Q32-like n=1 Tax=Impatiens glandulifera TaxID=253017 RepID=UPI001FB08193|nr:cytochrome P450 81Q32-like [Impatiens glandulifera]